MKRVILPLVLLLCLTPLMPVPAAAQDDAGGDDLPWWNDRVFYEIFVRSFYDSDGDGIGDLQGVISKLDYLNDGDVNTLTDLGVTGIWLMPVMQSPSYHGYDVMDYMQIEEDYGTNEDFKALVAAAHERGIVVIVDLVLNHTSTEHPWFIDAQTPGAVHEDWYRWEVDPDTRRGPWNQPVWHRSGDRYYYGVFWSGMPDLNYETPEVTEAMYEVARFWLDEMGADGFRMDAVKYLYDEDGIFENMPETHEWLHDFNAFTHDVKPDALTVGEVWNSTQIAAPYVVNEEVDLVFEFDLAEAMLMAARWGSANMVIDTQADVVDAYPRGQYAAFLTNHDQNRVMSMMRGDVNGAKLAASLLLTQPGVPFIYYGEEIGMSGTGDHENIRTPMQWDAAPDTAGFTDGTPWEGLAGDLDTANVAVQTVASDSLLNHYRALIHLRNAHPALRTGAFIPVESDTSTLYCFVRAAEEETLIVIINMSGKEQSAYTLTLAAGPFEGTPGGALTVSPEGETLLALNAEGGFDTVGTLPILTPYSTTILQFVP